MIVVTSRKLDCVQSYELRTRYVSDTNTYNYT